MRSNASRNIYLHVAFTRFKVKNYLISLCVNFGVFSQLRIHIIGDARVILS